MEAEEQFAVIRRHTMGDALREHRRSRPEMLASVDGAERLTYRDLDIRVNRLATALKGRGVRPGDRLVWLGQNSAKIMELLLACAKIGCSICPANWRLTAAEFCALVRTVDPRIVFWQNEEIAEGYDIPKEEWQDADRIWIQNDGSGADSYEALVAAGWDEDHEEPVDPESPLLAIGTAAFDGRAKAAQLSHTAIMLQGLLSARGQLVDERSVYLMSGPMFHIGVLMGGFATFISGGTCVYVHRLEPVELLHLIARERATHAYLPGPTIERMWEEDPDGKHDLSSLFPSRDLTGWIPPLAIPRDAPFMRSFAQYGQTEIMGSVVLGWLGGEGAGRPAPFVQVRLLDDAGNDVPDGEPGEIAVRGPFVMCGYHGCPEENAARTRDGWYRTRDVGRRNRDGSIAFVCPKTTMIKSGLENIYPAEVENCIRKHPAVKDVCVIGVPDPKWAQNVKAIVALKDGATADPSEIIEHCRAQIASYKKPKVVEFAAELPRLPNGMIDRSAADAAWGGGGYPSAD